MDSPLRLFSGLEAPRSARPGLARFRFPDGCEDPPTIPLRLGRSTAATLLCLGLSLLLLPAVGCDKGVSRSPATIVGDSSTPSLDARGGSTETSPTQVRGPDNAAGEAGAGGEIRVSSGAGDIDIRSRSRTVFPQTPVIAGDGIDVAPGETRTISGLQSVDFLRVQTDGTLRLSGHTLILSNGDVDISGDVVSMSAPKSGDAFDLTLDTGGIIRISGSVDCSGKSNRVADDFQSVSGGHGGRILMLSRASSDDSVGPHFLLTGLVRANGGDVSEATSSQIDGRPGTGGEVSLGTLGTMLVTGKAQARAGRTTTNEQLTNAAGGVINLVAVESVQIFSADRISAAGGSTVGLVGGDGGSIVLEAADGTIEIDGTDIDVSGGALRLNGLGSGGTGGEFLASGDAVRIANSLVDADGGGITRGAMPDGSDSQGEGGGGGRIELAGYTELTVASTVRLDARGGATNLTGFTGGLGGEVRVVNQAEENLDVLDFQGMIDITGGLDSFGSPGEDGSICHRGASPTAVDRMVGSNPYPASTCSVDGESGVEGSHYISFDLDCDDSTPLPSRVDFDLPVVTGMAFFRVRPGAASSVTIALNGQAGSDLKLYAGEEAVFGSLSASVYSFSSTSSGSEESVEIDLTTFTPGDFISVAIVESTFNAGTITLDVACGSAADPGTGG